MEEFAKELKKEIEKLDRHHDRIINIGEVFQAIDTVVSQKEFSYDANKDKVDALIRYIENYDYKNLSTLMFPKEDAEWLLKALRMQKINIEMNQQETCNKNIAFPNTEITYIYRGDSNKKTWFTYVLRGAITEKDKEIILDCLADDYCEFFKPCMVGLPDGNLLTEEDDWFEWIDSTFLTDKEPTLDIPIYELVKNFIIAKSKNWGVEKIEEKERD